MKAISVSFATSLVAVLMTVGGCGSNKNDKPADSSISAAMPGMAGMSSGNGMMDSMGTHLNTMMTASTGELKALLPMHRQTVGNMISRMNQDMRSMNTPATPAWTATMDSVRQDLIHQPDMSARDLAASLPAHGARITRLLEMHRDMMVKVKS